MFTSVERMEAFTVRLSMFFTVVVLLCPAASSGDTMEMFIISFTAESSLVPRGGVIVLRCRVANMDVGKFVRYIKLVPDPTGTSAGGTYPVILTTNAIKEGDIKPVERYSINRPKKNYENGYDFVLTITDAQVEDSGVYVCSIPQLNSTSVLEVSVVNDPTSIEIYVDDHLVTDDGAVIHFDHVTQHNISCTASGGYPQPVLSLSFDRTELEPTSKSACRVESGNYSASFLAHVTCTSTASISDLSIDYAKSGRAFTCMARSPGSVSAAVMMSFVPILSGGPPEISCKSVFLAQTHDRNVVLLCQIVAFPPLTDAYVQWTDGGLLRPTAWQNGIKFASHDHSIMAYHRPQYGNYSLLELALSKVFPEMFRTYNFVAVNEFGSVGHLVTLEKGHDLILRKTEPQITI